jgi:hypothetical protein
MSRKLKTKRFILNVCQLGKILPRLQLINAVKALNDQALNAYNKLVS